MDKHKVTSDRSESDAGDTNELSSSLHSSISLDSFETVYLQGLFDEWHVDLTDPLTAAVGDENNSKASKPNDNSTLAVGTQRESDKGECFYEDDAETLEFINAISQRLDAAENLADIMLEIDEFFYGFGRCMKYVRVSVAIILTIVVVIALVLIFKK